LAASVSRAPCRRREHALELRSDEAAHAGDALERVHRLDPVDQLHALGDALAEIADALEFGGDLQRGNGLAQVARQRLAKGEQAEDLLLDFDLDLVDLRVARDHGFGQGEIALGNGLDRVGKHVFRKTAHAGEITGEFLQILRK
jgi:hypothetical protein